MYPAGDQYPRWNGRRAAPFEHACLALRSDRDHEVDKRSGDDSQRRQARHVVGRGLDVLRADLVVAEHAHEDDQEDDRED
jgi:hypothetical protein